MCKCLSLSFWRWRRSFYTFEGKLNEFSAQNFDESCEMEKSTWWWRNSSISRTLSAADERRRPSFGRKKHVFNRAQQQLHVQAGPLACFREDWGLFLVSSAESSSIVTSTESIHVHVGVNAAGIGRGKKQCWDNVLTSARISQQSRSVGR